MDDNELLSTFTTICDKSQIKVLIDPVDYSIQSPAAIDVEHDEAGNLVGIGVYDGMRSLFFTRVSELLRENVSRVEIIAHNGKGDFDSLRQWGIPVSDSQLIWDTMLLGHIIDSSQLGYGLKDMAARELGISYPSYEDIVGKHKRKTKKAPKCPQLRSDCCERRTLDKWPVPIVAMYNGLDCYATFNLYEKQAKTLRSGVTNSASTSQYFEEVEKHASYVFGAMETRGIRLDLPYLKELKLTLEGQQRPLNEAIKAELGPINLNSSKQLLGALNAKQIQPMLKGKASTDKRALEPFKNTPIVQLLLQFGELETLLSSFVIPYLERQTEIVHPFFNQCGTRTGRPTCSNPNLLQIPKRTNNGKLVRRMFIPRDGMLLGDCDFGQIEPRVLAHLSKDPVLCQMFNDGVDFHTFTAERLGISRDRAKVLNLSVGYRATFKSVMAQLGVTREEAQEQINKWWALFPALRRWQESLIYSSKASGYCTTLLGRRIKVDGLASYNSWQKEAAERQLINNITQGSAAEIMKKAMISISRKAPNLGLLVQVYDELLFESPVANIAGDLEDVKMCMETAVKLDVPLTVDSGIGPSWADIN